jgi:glycosyltransferase involved in cell wall biosynthesis
MSQHESMLPTSDAVPVTPPSRIAHVEVGGSFGGSVVCLDVYLRHCNAQRFHHEALFYQCPLELRLPLEDRWPLLDLDLPVPGPSAASRTAAWQQARDFLASHPGWRRVITEVRGLGRILSDLPRAIRLARLFRRKAYDLVHCNNNFNYQVATLLATWLGRKPLVAHFRTPLPLGLSDRWLARIPVCLVAISQAGAEYLRRQGVRTPIVICHDPLENPEFSAANASRLRPDLLAGGNALVGTISRLEGHKGLEDLLAVARDLRSRLPGARYVVVGRGPRLEVLRDLAAKWGVMDRIRFLGFQPNAFDHSACFDVFVNPSHNEGGPLVVLEAMLMGLPVVSTRVGLVPEWISDEGHGLIVEPGNPVQLADAIERLLSNPVEARAMAARGAVRARQLCDPDSRARELDDVLAAAFATHIEREPGRSTPL